MVTFVETREYGCISTISACHRLSYPRTITCLLGKFFLAGACNFSTSRFSALTTFPSDPTIIDWLTHNNARNEITLRFISFFKRYLLYVCHLCRSYCSSLLFMSFVLPFFAVHYPSYCRFLSFMSFVLSFFAVRIDIFFIVLLVCLSFFSVIFQ